MRVIIEHEDGAIRWAAERALSRAGFDVACCGGPAELADGVCPLVVGEGCSLVESADVLVNGLPVDRSEVLTAQRANVPDVPLLLWRAISELPRFGDAAMGCAAVSQLATDRELAVAIRAVGARGASVVRVKT